MEEASWSQALRKALCGCQVYTRGKWVFDAYKRKLELPARLDLEFSGLGTLSMPPSVSTALPVGRYDVATRRRRRSRRCGRQRGDPRDRLHGWHGSSLLHLDCSLSFTSLNIICLISGFRMYLFLVHNFRWPLLPRLLPISSFVALCFQVIVSYYPYFLDVFSHQKLSWELHSEASSAADVLIDVWSTSESARFPQESRAIEHRKYHLNDDHVASVHTERTRQQGSANGTVVTPAWSSCWYSSLLFDPILLYFHEHITVYMM